MGSGCQAKLIAFTFLSLFGTAAVAENSCREDSLAVRGDWGQARFSVEVADDKVERAQGLMHRESMPKSAGMLFVYPEPQVVGFWMENTLIPLDMLFLDSTGVVQKIHSNAIPLDKSPIYGGDNIQYVLEINGGLSNLIGISVGSEIQHPSIEKEYASWPC
ncbi:hypothetical protein ROA7450_01802 [Roseovarius albus]|uniref:ACR n=1 Tax=Roseovarius albus TaxID=1247867 RepID=A0A1X6Z3I9_9RHOB|nr:DUF192 domain-containing protein [Roseovarius albus]SLN37583.1 hypothetical protein ROA7450_01802 [Roseovarius albus]